MMKVELFLSVSVFLMTPEGSMQQIRPNIASANTEVSASGSSIHTDASVSNVTASTLTGPAAASAPVTTPLGATTIDSATHNATRPTAFEGTTAPGATSTSATTAVNSEAVSSAANQSSAGAAEFFTTGTHYGTTPPRVGLAGFPLPIPLLMPPPVDLNLPCQSRHFNMTATTQGTEQVRLAANHLASGRPCMH